MSGDRDRGDRCLAQTEPAQAMDDGRIDDLEEGSAPTSLIPLISDNWFTAIGWVDVGDDDFPDDKRELLEGYADQAHDQGRRIRFWASPDTPFAWQVQRDAGVDLINTDDLAGLSAALAE